MIYTATHFSVNDGSTAMQLGRPKGSTITLVNEDGYMWTDPQSKWQPIPEES